MGHLTSQHTLLASPTVDPRAPWPKSTRTPRPACHRLPKQGPSMAYRRSWDPIVSPQGDVEREVWRLPWEAGSSSLSCLQLTAWFILCVASFVSKSYATASLLQAQVNCPDASITWFKQPRVALSIFVSTDAKPGRTLYRNPSQPPV